MASPETSAAYLARYNFKALMEWLTARCILHRPDDPMAFCRDLLEKNIELRGGKGTPYDPTVAPRFLKECYDDAMNAADEHGIIHPEACRDPIDSLRQHPHQIISQPQDQSAHNNNKIDGVTAAPSGGSNITLSNPCSTDLNTTPATATVPVGGGTGSSDGMTRGGSHIGRAEEIRPLLLRTFQEICEIARPEVAAAAIVTGACKAVNGRRGALFKVVSDAGALLELGAESMSMKRSVKPGHGLVGKAALGPSDASAVLVSEPSKEEAFDVTTDLPRGGGGGEVNRAPALIYGPVKDGSGGTWGVLVVAEPMSGEAFEERSLESFRAVSDMAAVSIRNSEMFGRDETESEKFRNMVEVIQAANDDLGINHLLYTIAKCLPLICEAQKCTCFLVDDAKDELWVVQGEVNIRVPKSKGIAGAVATSGKAENISDVYADPRFNKDVDVATGFQTHSILAMPVKGGADNKVIAVVQLINKQGGVITEASPAGCDSAAGRHFTEQDLVVIEAFLSLLGPQIFTSSMVQFKRKMHIKVSKVGGDEQESFPASSAMRSMKPRQRSMGALRISDSGHLAEDEEEDGDGGSDLDKDSATCTSDDG